MDTITCIKTRRSIRRFEQRPIDREVIQKLVEAASYAPSWKNTQIVRYTVIENRELIDAIAQNAVLGFSFNTRTMEQAQALVIQSIVTGVCGYESDGRYSTSKEDGWEMYDAGISAQTFCLAAQEYGVGTVIMGIFDGPEIAKRIELPQGQEVAAVIAMGYPAEQRTAPERKPVSELLRFL